MRLIMLCFRSVAVWCMVIVIVSKMFGIRLVKSVDKYNFVKMNELISYASQILWYMMLSVEMSGVWSNANVLDKNESLLPLLPLGPLLRGYWVKNTFFVIHLCVIFSYPGIDIGWNARLVLVSFPFGWKIAHPSTVEPTLNKASCVSRFSTSRQPGMCLVITVCNIYLFTKQVMYRHDCSSIMVLTGVCTVSSYSLSVDPYNNSSPFCQRAFIPFSSDSDASFSHREKLAQATVTKVLVSKSTSDLTPEQRLDNYHLLTCFNPLPRVYRFNELNICWSVLYFEWN